MIAKKKDFFEEFIFFELVFFNGAVFFQSTAPGVAMLFFFTSCLFFYVSRKRNKRIPRFNYRIICCLVGWTLINTYVFHTDAINKSFLDYLLYTVGTGLVVSIYEFEYFRNKLLRHFAILVAISIAVHFLAQFRLFPSTQIGVGGGFYDMSLFIFNTSVSSRLSSVYWEPGQFQVVVFFVLSLFYEELKSWASIKAHFKEFSVIVIGLLLTLSTAAYITLAIFITGILLTSKIVKRYRIMIPFMLLLASGFVYILWYSNVVQDKLNMESESSYNSYMGRMADNQGLLNMITERPIVGYGIGTAASERAKAKMGIETQSNGWLRMGAENGCFYLMFIILLLYNGIRRREYSVVDTSFILTCMIVSQSNEGNAFLPYVSFYIFKYYKN